MGNYPEGDTFSEYDEESAVPFADMSPGRDPNPGASWGSTGDAAFGATAMAVTVQPDGDVDTRWKRGQATSTSDGGIDGGTP